MNYNHPNRNSSTIGIRLMCATVFMLFAFLYLYFFQADVLIVAQHVLSHGLTHYNRLVGALLITVFLQLLQLMVYALLRLRKRSHALTYLPSMLLLGVVTDVNSDIDQRFSIGAWYWVLPILIVVWLFLAFLAKALQNVEPDSEPVTVFSRAMWINMFTMALLIIGVMAVSNTDAVFHYRARAEVKLMEGDYEGALDVGRKSLESDASLHMIRMYALSRCGKLADQLFTYPVTGNSHTMLPLEGQSHFAVYTTDSLYRYLGAIPLGTMTNRRYLELLEQRDSLGTNRMLADYRLCGLLLDKSLDEFVQQLYRSYGNGDSLDIDTLPRHYREAMMLYTHMRSNPVAVYHNAVMDEDWQNLQDLERRYPDKTERKGKVEDQYRGTYWYYYEYE